MHEAALELAEQAELEFQAGISSKRTARRREGDAQTAGDSAVMSPHMPQRAESSEQENPVLHCSKR